jgi:hypothetical protein
MSQAFGEAARLEGKIMHASHGDMCGGERP